MRRQEYNDLSLILVLIIISITLCFLQTTTSAQAQVTNLSQSLLTNYSGMIFPPSQTGNWMNTTYGMPGINLNEWSNIPTTWANIYSNQVGTFLSNAYDKQITGVYQYSNLSSMGMNQFVTQSGYNWMNWTGLLSGGGINQFGNLQSTQTNRFGTYLGNWTNLGGLIPGIRTSPFSFQSTAWAYVPPVDYQSSECGCGE